MIKLTPKKRALEVNARLTKLYPQAKTPLLHQNPFQLLVATILSAQCTDNQVNKVTPALFTRFATPAAFATAKLSDVEKLIYSTGFYKNKAKNIVAMAQTLLNEFDGKVPQNMDLLTTLPGVGRKTANVVLSEAFGQNAGVVVDTHVLRLSWRLGLSHAKDAKAKDAVKVEQDLMQLIPSKDWRCFSLRLIFLGRQICFARKPNCIECVLNDICPKVGVIL